MRNYVRERSPENCRRYHLMHCLVFRRAGERKLLNLHQRALAVLRFLRRQPAK